MGGVTLLAPSTVPPRLVKSQLSLSLLPLRGPLHHPHPPGRRIQDKFPPVLSPQLWRGCWFLPWLLRGELAASPRGREAEGGHLARMGRDPEVSECGCLSFAFSFSLCLGQMLI